MMQRRLHTNKERLKGFTDNLLRLDEMRKRVWEKKEISNFFSLCIKSHQAYGALNGSDSSGERDGRLPALESGGPDKPISIILGFQTGKTSVRPVKLPRIENVPPYTTWIYLDRYTTTEKISVFYIVFSILLRPRLFQIDSFMCGPFDADVKMT